MMERQIKLSREDVLDFVNAASKCDCDIDISYNRVIIDAKSILGILSMDLNRVLTVKCHGEDGQFMQRDVYKRQVLWRKSVGYCMCGDRSDGRRS